MVTSLAASVVETGKAQTPVFTGINVGEDDLTVYDEGTWNPVVKIGTTTITSVGSLGYFTRIGNRVYIDALCKFNRATNTGDITIEGLPVASASGTTGVLSMSGGSYLDFSPALRGIIAPSTSKVAPQRLPASTTATIYAMNETHVKESTEVEIYLSGHYRV
jgi:hypothetical protein